MNYLRMQKYENWNK